MYKRKISLLLAVLTIGNPVISVYAEKGDLIEKTEVVTSTTDNPKIKDKEDMEDPDNSANEKEDEAGKISEKDEEITRAVGKLTRLDYLSMNSKQLKLAMIDLKELKTTISLVENTNLYADDLKKVNDKILEVENQILLKEKEEVDSEENKLDVSKIKSQVKIEQNGKSIYATMPKLPEFNVKYFIGKSSGIIKEGVSTGDKVELPIVSEKTIYNIKLEIQSKTSSKTLKIIEINNLSFNDTEKPKIESIYVKNDRVYVDFTDNYILDNKPLGYKLGKDKSYRYTSKDYFDLDDEESVDIVVRDLFGNETKDSFKAKKKNEIIKGDVSNKTKKDIDDAKIDRYKNIKNLVAIESNDEIDIFDVFEDYLEDTFSSRQMKRLKVDSSTKLKNDYTLKTSKKGLHEFVFYDKEDDDEDLYVYVYIRESKKDRDYKIRDIKSKEKNMETSDYEIAIKDYIEVDFYRDSKMKDKDKEKELEKLLVMVEDLDIIYNFKDKVKLREDKTNKIKLIDVEEDNIYTIEIKQSAKAKDNKPITITVKEGNAFTKQYTDIGPTFWATNDITRLSKLNLVKGYPDGSYRPTNTMTVREFLTLYGRFLNIVSDTDKRPVKTNVKVKVIGNQWGVEEMENVYSRINTSKLKTFKTGNMNRKISREEVAFIIANTININNPGVKETFTDVKNSPYRQEINVLYNDKKIKGFPNKTFKPSANVTRAEIATFVSNLF